MASTSSAHANGSSSSRKPGPTKPPVVQPGTGNNILINPCQRGNPILECVKNVGKEYGDIVADYQVGRTTGVLFLSLKYHRLHPEYILQRIEKMGRAYNLRILLIQCDVSEHQDSIRELTKTCLLNDITIIVAWSTEEAGFYLSTFKQFEHKPPTMIKERIDKDYNSILRTALTSINKVNKTDVEILRTSVGSFADISRASAAQLLQLPGFGQVKVKRIKDAFEKPFRSSATNAVLPYSSQPASSASAPNARADGRQQDKGKQKATSAAEAPAAGTSRPRQRSPSPVWDIELDLDLNPTPSPPQAAPVKPLNLRKRPPSPVWDIELDLNASDVDDDAMHKRHKSAHNGGASNSGAEFEEPNVIE